MVYTASYEVEAAANEIFMALAVTEARKAGERGEVPVGAVLVDPCGNLIAQDGNRNLELADPTGHAEILVIRTAGRKINNYRLNGCSLYVTLEPCAMCAAAMVHARIGRLIFGAVDLKGGAVVSLFKIGQDSRLNHQIEIQGGLLADECSTVLRDFFKLRRKSLKS